MNLRFRQVRYFVEIVDAGSMTRAAERLNLAPTALSLQIKSLEQEFDVTLLTRHPRGVTPTEAGMDFYDNARRILTLLDETKDILAGRRVEPARFRLGLSPSIVHAIGLDALMPVFDCGEEFSIDLVEGKDYELISRLETGDLDFMLGAVGPCPSSVSLVEVAEEEMMFVTSSTSGLSDGAVSLEIALTSNLIRFGKRSMTWDLVSRRASACGLPIGPARIVESANLMRRMIRRGLGTAILPISLIEPERRAGHIRVHPIEGNLLTRRLCFAWREPVRWAGAERAVQSYIDTLVSEFHAVTAPHSKSLAPISAAPHPAS